ncbi:hypothetical protein, partial [Aquibacillus salsiterrae]
CSLNSFENDLRSLLVIIDSPPTFIESSLYDLNESVQLSVTYPNTAPLIKLKRRGSNGHHDNARKG